jgi:putative endopeptidase
VIGHEISHGFDDKGSQSDGDGNLRDWWTKEDRANFKAKTDMLVKQYNGYSPLPGYNVNGELTLGENIGDNSGAAIAYKAYKISLGGKGAGDRRPDRRPALLHGLRPGVAQQDARRAADQLQVKTDPHSPGQFRANGTLMQPAGLLRSLRRQAGRQDVPGAEERVIIW